MNLLEIPSRRKDVARSLRTVRWKDRNNFYNNYRSETQYIQGLLGLEHFFDYVRENQDGLGSNKVYDLGCGVAYALGGLSVSEMAKGLELFGITAQWKAAIGGNFDSSRVKITSVEKMDGVEDNSVAAMFSDYGALSYTKDAEQAAITIDRKLVPGGIIKAVFSNSFFNISAGEGPWAMKKQWTKLGYDLFMQKDKPNRSAVLLAIKPVGFKSPENLMKEDLQDYEDQIERVSKDILNN